MQSKLINKNEKVRKAGMKMARKAQGQGLRPVAGWQFSNKADRWFLVQVGGAPIEFAPSDLDRAWLHFGLI